MKKVVTILLTLALILQLPGCTTNPSDNSGTSDTPVNPPVAGENKPQDDTVIAAAKGDVENAEMYDIRYGEFDAQYVYFLYSNGMKDDSRESLSGFLEQTGQEATEDNITAISEELQNVRRQIIDFLISENVYLLAAKELGISELTDEEIKACEDTTAEFIEGWRSEIMSEVQAEFPDAAEDEINQKVEERFDEFTAKTGMTAEAVFELEKSGIISEKVWAAWEETNAVSDNEVTDYVAAKEAEAKALYESSPQDYEYNTELQIYYVPEGSKMIKQILLMFPTEAMYELMSLRDTDAAAADAFRADELAKLQETADEALNRVNSGEDFDALIAEYTGDTSGVENGYLVIPGSSTYMAEFAAGANALANVGDTSGLVSTDYGYHILKYSSVATAADDDEKRTSAANILFEEKLTEMSGEKTEHYKNLLNYEVDYAAVGIADETIDN